MCTLEYRCPACKALFRETTHCTRCGADLTRIMRIAAQAYRYRTSARNALQEGSFRHAHALAEKAQRLCCTEYGRRLYLLTQWLASVFHSV